MDRIIRQRNAGDPLEPVMDVSPEMGERCLLVTNGVPDFVLAPEEFGQGALVPGVNGGSRCDVNGIHPAPKWAPPCAVCHTTDSYIRMWHVTHTSTGREFLLFECGCKQINWALRPEGA